MSKRYGLEEFERLTADVKRVAKGCRNLGVELNHKIVLLGDVIIALLNQLSDPLSERLAN